MPPYIATTETNKEGYITKAELNTAYPEYHTLIREAVIIRNKNELLLTKFDKIRDAIAQEFEEQCQLNIPQDLIEKLYSIRQL